MCGRNSSRNNDGTKFPLERDGYGIWSSACAFQEIYEDHFQAQDELAERIRSIGHTVDGRLSAMIDISKVMEDAEGCHQSDKEMIIALVEAQKTLSATLSGASDIAAENGDKLTEDLCIERGRAHEKFAWLLQSHIN